MDPALTAFVGAIALLAAIPAWLAGSILKRHARQDGEGVSDWIPLGLLPYGFDR
jgi:biopolymer transport protein ExbB/TolQ